MKKLMLFTILQLKTKKTYLNIETINVKTKNVTLYPSIGAAVRALGYHQPSIYLYLKENITKPLKGFIFI